MSAGGGGGGGWGGGERGGGGGGEKKKEWMKRQEGKDAKREKEREEVEITHFPKTQPKVKEREDKTLARTDSPSTFANALSNLFTNRRAACQVIKETRHWCGVPEPLMRHNPVKISTSYLSEFC